MPPTSAVAFFLDLVLPQNWKEGQEENQEKRPDPSTSEDSFYIGYKCLACR